MEHQRSGMDELQPMLQQAHETLEDALDEACDAKPASQETTGEMIRLEETLSVAAEAAKRAVSIRRRLREEAERSQRPGAIGEQGALEKRDGHESTSADR